MSLRARLAITFVLVALVPLGTAALILGHAVPGADQDRRKARAEGGIRAAALALRDICQETTLLSAQVTGRAGVQGGAVAAAADAVKSSRLPVTVQIGGVGGAAPTVVGAASPVADLGTVQDCNDATDLRAVVARQPALPDGSVVTVAVPFDAALLAQLKASAGLDVTLVGADGSVLSTLTGGNRSRAATEIDAGKGAHRSGGLVVDAQALPGGAHLVVSTGAGSSSALLGALFVLVLVSAGVAAVLGTQLARLVTKPLADLSAAAGRISAGDLDTRIAADGKDEVATLGAAFNDMTSELRSHISALEGSRDELRRNLTRLGETLSSTHDLDRILSVIVETAAASVRADAALLMLVSAGRGDLYAAVGRNLAGRVDDPATGEGARPLRLPAGEGVLGHVFATGEAVRGRTDEPGHPQTVLPSPKEPRAQTLIAVPLRASGKVIGVLGLYDREDGKDFDETDLGTIHTFAAQAGVAIDNVLLHQEAQRLSITDGLTGLWNYRYLTMALAREVERAVRFQRPLAVLMLDLDRFKNINDRYGHQRGDAVLVEVATRVKGEIREVDVLARYGGEELVCVLPETDAGGAVVIAERIAEAVREAHFEGSMVHEEPLSVTVSIGVAVYPEHGASGAALLRAADEALYEAKRAGRDAVRVARPERLDPDARRRHTGDAPQRIDLPPARPPASGERFRAAD
ncbi:MAG TPA: diguanylate cyclase [Mycobacteriales bacterium]|nr:diguanylate cyclase [Mycobacteriales bacterium]